MLTDGGVPDILIVDDVPANVRVLADVLRAEGYRTRSAVTGEAALLAAEKQPPDLILLDVMMPGLDGYEVCRRLKVSPALAGVPVIFLSALSETESKVEAFAAGGVDYVTKPFHLDEVRARVSTHLRLHQLRRQVELYSRYLEDRVQEQVREIADSQMATIFALARLAESRDDETGTHLERVQAYCALVANALDGSEGSHHVDSEFVGNLVHASPLHDIGKVAVSDTVLLKPGRLTEAEFEVMKTHTTAGAQTLEAVQREYPRNAFIATGIEIARWHHERWDGSGYPDGIAGDDIPLSARIMAIADVYDALRSRRVYKEPISHDESCEIIRSASGTHFDPILVQAFCRVAADFDRIVSAQP